MKQQQLEAKLAAVKAASEADSAEHVLHWAAGLYNEDEGGIPDDDTLRYCQELLGRYAQLLDLLNGYPV